MLCEISSHGNLFTTWAALAVIGFLLAGAMSAVLFRLSYWKPAFERWQRKTNPEYPDPLMVRREVLMFAKGVAIAVMPAALALWLVHTGWSKAYCGLGDYGWGYLVFSFFAVWIGSDFLEFLYHRFGHLQRRMWREHKGHHVYHNPTPFSVIADDWTDQFCRALPLLLFPLVMPINIDLLFLTFALFFYGYGAYLHWGHEWSWLTPHQAWINTSYHHYIHHARSTFAKPYHTGFFFKLWDDLFGSRWQPEVCECASCSIGRGERTREAFERVAKPDYSVLLDPSFWLSPPSPRRAEERPAVA